MLYTGINMVKCFTLFYSDHINEFGYFDAKKVCEGYRDGFYPDPMDCTKFIFCHHGFTYNQHCPPGTVWSTRRGTCDYPYNADEECKNEIPRYYNVNNRETIDQAPSTNYVK